MAIKFTEQNCIKLHSSTYVLYSKSGKTIIYGTGETPEKRFIKLWIVARYPKIVVASYESEKESREVKICDSIIDSFTFRTGY